MPGQCYGCGAQFGVFKKEHGCKNCGFAFCSKCLNEKAVPVPKRNNAKHHVCHKCYKILTGQVQASTEKRSYDLPEAYLKRMAAFNERESNGSGVAGSSKGGAQNIPANLRRLEKPDRDIAMRLEKLKETNKPKVKVSDADLNTRLAQLKGQTYDPVKKPVYHPPDRRTQVEQVDDLMEQLSQEVAIDDLRPDPVKDVEARLAHLKHGEGSVTNKPNFDSNNINRQGKGSSLTGDNDLGKVNKMEGVVKPYDQNIGLSPAAAGSQTGTRQDTIDPQEMHRLMSQAARELEDDAMREVAGLHKDKEISERLRQIQAQRRQGGQGAEGAEGAGPTFGGLPGTVEGAACLTEDSSDEENDDVEAKRVLQRYLEEMKIDEKAVRRKRARAPDEDGSPKLSNIKPQRAEDFASDSDYDDSDELPYCCICTEDAITRCRDCDLDLYCARCFRESHQEMDIFDHRTTPYKPPKGYR